MRLKGIGMSRSAVLAAAMCLLLVAVGCGTHRPARVGRKAEPETFSIKGTGCELGRGVTNIALCWLEIPYEIEGRIRENRQDAPFSVVANVFDAALGTINGAVWGVERALGGAFEIVLSPFPPYGPLMEPAFPPYLNRGNEPEQQ